MNDDWRLRVDPHESGHARMLTDLLEAQELEHTLSTAFHDRVIVSREGTEVFLYAGSRDQVEGARELVSSLAGKHGWKVELDLRRWHPVAEDWEDPDLPLPDSDEARRAEHEALIATERREVEESGHPEFEVRVNLPSRHEAHRFAEQLRSEGLPIVHRWRYLLIGVTDEDSAKTLTERLRNEVPPEAKVTADGTWQAAYGERPPNPFAFLGGLGG